MMKKRIFHILKEPYVFSIISKVMIVLLGFAYSVCQSRYLGASLKGEVAFVDNVTKITLVLFGLGIHQAYPYFKKKTGEDVAPFFLRLLFAMTGIYFLIAVLLTVLYHSDIRYAAIFLLTPCLVYNRVVSYINMVESPNRKNMTELTVNFLEVLAVLAVWKLFPPTVQWGIFLLLFKDLLLGGIYTWRLRDKIRKPVKLTLAQSREIIRFGFFPMVCLLMTTLNYRIDIIMLKRLVTSAEVGVYSVGVMLAERVWLIPDALKEVMISNLSKGKDFSEVGFVIRICNTACIFVVLGIVILGQPFINFFYGKEYSGAYTVTVIILIGVVFMIYYKMIGAYNVVHGKQKENFYYLVASVLTNIAANLLLIPRFGNNGAAMASILSYGMAAFLFTRHFSRETGVGIREMLLVSRQDIRRVKTLFGKHKKK